MKLGRTLAVVAFGAGVLFPVTSAAPAGAAAPPPVDRPATHHPLTTATSYRAAARGGQMAPPAHGNEPPPGAVEQPTLVASKGGPVMHHVVVYTVFWVPPGTSVSPNYISLINRFFGDLNNSSYYGILGQYTDSTGGPGADLTLGGTWTDATPFPNGEGSQATPVTDDDIHAEVERAVAANAGWVEGDVSHEVFVYLPAGVWESADNARSFQDYCGYHSFFNTTTGGTVVYSLLPYGATQVIPGQPACLDSPDGEATPNELDSDIAINVSAHELGESVTDPLINGYQNAKGITGEVGDLCVAAFGTPAADGSNVTLNGHPYNVQGLWSNQSTDPANPGLATGCVLSLVGSPQVSSNAPPVAGQDRIDTSVAASGSAFPDPTVERPAFIVVARADDYPDALTGASLLNASPTTVGDLLINPADHLDERVQAEITRLLPPGGTVFLLGGDGALSPAVEQAIQAAGFKTTRLAGVNRFATAAAVANHAYSAYAAENVPDNQVDILLATGTNFPDAISAGGIAASRGDVVLLTLGGQMTPESQAVMQAHPNSPVFAIGGPAAQADPQATAIVGINRYDTAAKTASQLSPKATLIALATGENFPDALSAADLLLPFEGGSGALLLTPNDALAPEAIGYLQGDTAFNDGWVVGGVIKQTVQDQFGTYVH